MNYLTVEELSGYAPDAQLISGKEANLIKRASLMIDTYCHRPEGLGVVSYTEQITLTSNGSHLSYFPIVALTEVKARWSRSNDPMYGVLGTPEWQDITLSEVELNTPGRYFFLPVSIYNAYYDEAKITYTAGYSTIPEDVKVACGIILTMMSMRVNPSARNEKIPNGLSITYDNDSFITSEVDNLLSRHVVRSYR